MNAQDRLTANDMADRALTSEQMRLERRLAALEFDAHTSAEYALVTTTPEGFTRTLTKAYEPDMEGSSIVHLREEKVGCARIDTTYFICNGRVQCEEDFGVQVSYHNWALNLFMLSMDECTCPSFPALATTQRS